MTVLTGARIVTPAGVVEDRALLIAGGKIDGLVHPTPDAIDLGGGWLLPGFIDTQVNGGGDVLFNDAPTIAGIRTVAEAHRRYGTTGILPTLITDTIDVVARALDAVDQAIGEGVPGVLGIHVEGPFLNPDKRGIHDPGRMQTLDSDAIEMLLKPRRGVTMVTLAPELTTVGAIRRLADGGVIVAAGHSAADYTQTRAALDAGLSGFTHLFNAMTQLGSREPGMVGAALADRASHFGLIVDGHHVHPATMRVAVKARGHDGVMLVTDAMPPVGGVKGSFTLTGREITIADGTCRAADGTIAGSALTMEDAFRNAMTMLEVPVEIASAMASANPATFLRLAGQTGAIAPGLSADLVHLDEDFRVTRTWIGGNCPAYGC